MIANILDSSAKLVFNGLTDGTFTDLGNYDQCIRDFIPSTEDEKQLNGKYCLLQIKPPLPQRRPHLKHSDRIFNFTDTSLQNPNAEYYGSLAHTMSKFQFEPHIGSDCYVEDVQKYNIKKLVQKLDFYSIMSIERSDRAEPKRWMSSVSANTQQLGLITHFLSNW
ncbi:unnamed protein product, partial [Oppiella nova]